MKKVLSLTTATLVIITGMSGCMARSGKMIMAPIKLETSKKIDTSSKQRVSGESCRSHIFMFPWGESEDRINFAIRNAIENGHKKGLKGDTLVNTTVEITTSGMMIYSKNCLVVEGDLTFKESGE